MRNPIRLGILAAVTASLLATGSSQAAPAKAPAGPAKKMKIVAFLTLETYGILKLQFLDAKDNPTKAPEGGEITYTTSITKPRKGTLPMTKAKWKPADKLYVFVGLAPRQRTVCPPRSYWIRVHFKAGRKRFSAYHHEKFNCL
jgi:hypothetical protein